MSKLKKFFIDMKKHWMLHLMALPAVAAVVIFTYVPMGGIVMAFQQMDLSKGPFTSPWVGLDNFKFLFASKDVWDITRNTILYNAVFIFLGLVLSMGLASVNCGGSVAQRLCRPC